MNGHIAMNEPAPSCGLSRTLRVDERHSLIRCWRAQPANHGLTLGMAEILAAREILLLVSGAGKREPPRNLLRHEITTEFPASFLWLHPN
jgi:galactosamine-6-phosphate isomerase